MMKDESMEFLFAEDFLLKPLTSIRGVVHVVRSCL